MMRPETKDHRYTMRVNSAVLDRIRRISIAIHAPLPELFTVAVLFLYQHATSPQAYTALKARLYAEDARHPNPAEPLDAP
jgi:hypothetical protein